MLPEEIRDEARAASRRKSAVVTLRVECDEFAVAAMPGLLFRATYEAIGEVTPDTSGDHITPNGPPEVECWLGDLLEWEISVGTCCYLPDWLQEHLATEYAGELDAAFLAAIGGQSALNNLAIEKAYG